jgi:hypothetical protein
MNIKKITLLFAALLSFNTSFYAKDVLVNVNDGTYPDYAKWYYFSFTSDEIVGSGDFTLINVQGNIGTEVPDAAWAARTDWDIAFHGSDIRTNNAEALLIAESATSSTSLDEVYATLTQAPADGYKADQPLEGMFYQRLFPMPPVRSTQLLACEATNGWATLGMGGNTVNPVVVVFKLANGKYVKVYLKEFFDEDGTGGFIDMEYAEIPLAGTNGISTADASSPTIHTRPDLETLNVRLSEPAEIAVYNLAGLPVKQVKAQPGEVVIPVSGWEKGTYIVKVNTPKENRTQKIIVR